MAKSHISPENKPLQLLLDENLRFEENSTIAADKTESQPELQKSFSYEQESHFHLYGEIMLDHEASIAHPSLHDVDGIEIDLTIDFE